MSAPHPECKTLWMGDIESWMDENYLMGVYSQVGLGNAVNNCKIIKDKLTGMPAGYGFVEFNSHDMAQHVYQTYNGAPIPSTNKVFRLNWASRGATFGSSGNRMPTGGPTISIGAGPSGGVVINSLQPSQNRQSSHSNHQPPHNEVSVYIGDLDPSVTQQVLLEHFRSRYSSVSTSKIIMDPISKHSKGYGFVKFRETEEAHRAIAEMNGSLLYNKPIKVSNAFTKNSAEAMIAMQPQAPPPAPIPTTVVPPPVPVQQPVTPIVVEPIPINLPPIAVQDMHPEHFTFSGRQQQLYQYYNSVITDTQKKQQLQKVMEQQYNHDTLTRATSATKRKTIKSELETIKRASQQTAQKSRKYVETLPKMSIYRGKCNILRDTIY